MINNIKKSAVRLYNSNYDAYLIFYAKFDLEKHTFQWYKTDDKENEGEPIEEQNGPTYPTSTEQIKKYGEENKYLYCKIIDINTHKEYKTEFIRLYSNVNKMIDSGTIFDDISSFDENGMFTD